MYYQVSDEIRVRPSGASPILEPLSSYATVTRKEMGASVNIHVFVSKRRSEYVHVTVCESICWYVSRMCRYVHVLPDIYAKNVQV
jgi:hypothetical protein